MPYLRIYIVFLFIASGFVSNAQNKTSYFMIEGNISKTVKIDWAILKTYKTISLDSMTVFNHGMQKLVSLKKIKGVLLKDILNKVVFASKSPKTLSEFYIVCVGKDGYKVVFSWNELFNDESGNHTMIVTEKDGSPTVGSKDAIELITPTDKVTARRYVKALSKIIIQKVN